MKMFFGSNKQMKFKNKNILITELKKAKVENDYNIAIAIGSHIIPYNFIQAFTSQGDERDEYYETVIVHEDEQKLLLINPVEEEKVIICGYYTFGENFKDKMKDFTKGKELNEIYFSSITDSLAELMRRNYMVLRKSHDKYGFSTYHISGTTYKLHLTKNYKLFEANNFRKEEEGLKSLIFNKEFDKFKTCYFCLTRDIDDLSSKPAELELEVEKIKSELIELLPQMAVSKCHDNVGIEYCEFRHFIQY